MGLSFDMDGAVAQVVASGELGRAEIEELDQYFELARANRAAAMMIQVREVPRISTSVLGHLVRRATELKEAGIVLGLVGFGRAQNPIVGAEDLAPRIAVYADVDRARADLRRRLGAVEGIVEPAPKPHDAVRRGA